MRYKASFFDRVLHFKEPAGTSRGVYVTHHSYYVRIEREGVVGIGECSALPDLSCDALPPNRYEEVLGRACAFVEQAGGIPYEMLRGYPSILFGLETAFLQVDAKGSAALFDTPFSRGEAGITINGLVWMGSFEEMFRRLQEKLEAGFRCVKLKIGAIDWEREMDLIRHIRAHFPKSDIELRVDANGAFTPANALERMELLARYDIHSIEQPIRRHQWREMSRLVLKPILHGGMTGCREWIGMARERGIGTWITSALESNVGLNAVAQFCAEVYGPQPSMPQGLGTGMLYTDNIDMPLQIRGDKLWYLANS